MTIFVEAPGLRETSTHQILDYKPSWELYEKRNKDVSEQLEEGWIISSYEASINNDELKGIISADWTDCSSVNDLTKSQEWQRAKVKCNLEPIWEQLYFAGMAMRNISMQTIIFEA